MNKRYSVYHGIFLCHTCKANVSSLRLYADDKYLTWMCEDKHLTKVSLQTKKSKRDYDRAI